jgi:ABC-type sulfate transport system permease subunit
MRLLSARRLGNYWAAKVLSGKLEVRKLEVSMTTKVLSAELARERAWRVYCLMNPSAQRQIKLKARLDSYLATLQTIDSNSLTVDGLKYLKRLETLGAEKSGEHR